MKFIKRKLKGAYEIQFAPHLDERGFFMRTFDIELFEEVGLDCNWVQENHSKSLRKGIIRGLHFQHPPFSEAKLVRCIRGTILDVFVDIRQGSPTYGQWDAIELSEDNKKAIFVPRGFAHGFCTLTEMSDIVYKVDNVYSSSHEGGLIWNDPDIGIDWPVKTPILSHKDQKNMSLDYFTKQFNGINV
ncbi:MAG TPA: dTDP-4-dehydrorhamnose 3,5-epimerase [bacterium]|nr:dTDP-4-dehydrorhamnose 3,5-epimerase [bacterium]